MTQLRFGFALLVMVAVFAQVRIAAADTITVCLDGSCDFTDVQSAINASVTGDTIEIAAGTYSPSATLSLAGKSITMRGRVDKAGAPLTVFDGSGVRQILAISASSSIIEGIRFQNGRAAAGGAMTIGGSSPQIVRCVFASNHATQFGGGVHSYQASPTYLQCRFENNSAIINGGGLYPVLSSSTFVECQISGNTAPNGSAMFLAGGCSCQTQIIATVICGNTNTSGSTSFVFAAGGNQWSADTATCISTVCITCFPDCDADGQPDVEEIMNGAVDINNDGVPDDCQCLGDLFADGQVNGADLGIVLSEWGASTNSLADINRDGTVNGVDLSIMLSAWGPCQ
jgi:hypothetical protein